jgi:hypothetical protein
MVAASFLTLPVRADNDPIAEIRSLLVQRNTPGLIVLSEASRLLSDIDRDGNGLDQNDIDQATLIKVAWRRAGTISRNLVYDLNGDLIVTRQEIEITKNYQMLLHVSRATGIREVNARKRQRDQLIDHIMRGDVNGDQKLEGLELSFLGKISKEMWQYEFISVDFAQALIKADPNSDGVVTDSEIRAILSKVAE